jgi:L-lysine 6-transaminase
VAQPDFFGSSASWRTFDTRRFGFDEVQTAGGSGRDVLGHRSVRSPAPPAGRRLGKKLGCGVVYMLYPMEDRGVLDSTWGGHLADMVRFVQEMKIVRREKLIEQVPEKSARLAPDSNLSPTDFPTFSTTRAASDSIRASACNPPSANPTFLDALLEHESLLLLGAGASSIRLRPHAERHE